MVRFNDKPLITTLSDDDIMPITDMSEPSSDKKINMKQLSEYIANLVMEDIPIAKWGNIIGELSEQTDLHNVLSSKMERYIVKLIKIGTIYSIQTYDGIAIDFNTLSTVIKDTSKYVVMTYGNSKLRPQYVSTNEIMFIGLDRASSSSKVLRVLFTPTNCNYETFELAEDAEVDAKLLTKQNTISDLDTIRSGAISGATALQPFDIDLIEGAEQWL